MIETSLISDLLPLAAGRGGPMTVVTDFAELLMIGDRIEDKEAPVISLGPPVASPSARDDDSVIRPDALAFRATDLLARATRPMKLEEGQVRQSAVISTLTPGYVSPMPVTGMPCALTDPACYSDSAIRTEATLVDKTTTGVERRVPLLPSQDAKSVTKPIASQFPPGLTAQYVDADRSLRGPSTPIVAGARRPVSPPPGGALAHAADGAIRVDVTCGPDGLLVGILIPFFDLQQAPQLARRIGEILDAYAGMRARVAINGTDVGRSVTSKGGSGHGGQRN